MQNWRKFKYRLPDGRQIGMRECVIPREGCCFVGADYPAIEMRTLAQLVIDRHGSWDLANQLNGGIDPHCRTAEFFYPGLSWDQIKARCRHDTDAKNTRDMCKIPNFGVPGGLGKPTTMQHYARTSYGKRISIAEAEALLEAVNLKQPDIGLYLRGIRHFRDGGFYTVPLPGCNVTRKSITYTAAANSGFQCLASRIMGLTGWQIMKETLDPGLGSALYGSHLVLFLHDDFMLETPIGQQTAAAKRLVEIMIDCARMLIPDVTPGVPEAYASACWSKDAKGNYDADGELQIWSPDETGVG